MANPDGLARQTRVTIATSSLRMGGAERVAGEQADRLRHEYEVTLLSLETPDSDFYPAPQVPRVVVDSEAPSGAFRRRWARLAYLRRHLRSGEADVVLAHQDWMAILLLLADLGPGGRRTKLVAIEHIDPASGPPRKMLRALRKLLYRRADAVVCLTDQGAEWLANSLGRDVETIPNPAPAPVHSEQPRPIDVISVGRLEDHKRVELFIDAVAELHERGRECTAMVVGGGSRHDALVARARSRNVDHLIEFTGAVDDVPDRLLRAKIYCLLSAREGHPMSLLESMAHGCVPVSVDCRTGPREIIEPGVDGLLLEPHPSAAVAADAIAGLLDDPVRQRKLSEGATRKVEQFSPTEIDKRWTALIARLAEGKQPER